MTAQVQMCLGSSRGHPTAMGINAPIGELIECCATVRARCPARGCHCARVYEEQTLDSASLEHDKHWDLCVDLGYRFRQITYAGDEATPGGSGGYEADFIDDGTTPRHSASQAPLRCAPMLCLRVRAQAGMPAPRI